MPPKTDKVEAEIRKLQKLEGNKSCADCSEKVPGYVDLTHNVFICTKCSGIHREFQFKVKGVSMSKFTEEDWAGLASMGNEKFNSDFLHHLPSRDILPSGADVNKLKDFIRQKYIDKKWHKDGFGGGSSSGVFVSGHPSNPAPNVAEDSGRLNIKLGRTNSATANRRASTGGMEIKIKAAAPSPSSTSSLTDSMDLLSMNNTTSTPTVGGNHDPFATSASSNGQSSGGNDFDPFGPSPAASKVSAMDSFDAFSSAPVQTNSNSNATFDPFGPAPTTNSSSNSSFSAFPAAYPAQNQTAPTQNANSFSNFGSHDPFATSHAAMPFIHTSPPVAGATSTPATPLNTSAPQPAAPAPAKNFSAFDDLLGPATAPTVTSNSLNPFDTASSASHMPPAPAGPAAGGLNAFAPTVPPANPYAGYGYPPQQPAQVPPGYPSYGYPPANGAPPNYPGYHPQQQQVPPGYPGYPAHVHPQHQLQQYQQYQHYMQHQQQQHQQQAPPAHAATAPVQVAPAAPAAVDPFASMTSNAWTAAAAGPRPSSHQHAPATHASASYGTPLAPAPAPTPASFAPAPAPVPATPEASVNPFDLF